ncbi:hypothetical protein BV25DRAFT_1819733 [Artomyces pyxidatus]|uniref:Uncharacterized protein n=1 Tax=Artomyces pyxidatus TaxID=48021 RepID=A0ACB8TG50_9AGAM|nr:hypothetical protein BV25DRAFT_1819733 [Artomyces pyxidatus]
MAANPMSFSDFEDSDLTDLSSEEDDYVPLAKKATPKKSAKTKKATYTVSNPLRPPRTTQYSAKSLYEQIVDSSIDLDPEYQRDVVWPESKQIGLIDSVFRNYYVPPIIFAVNTADDGTETRVCIDGKQRLTSLQKFMDGMIPHKDSVTGRRFWYKSGPGQRTLLPKNLLQIFANKQIVCVEYDNLTDDQEREIFQRVQLGVALTPAERMQAITGPWPSFIREVQSKVLGDEGFGEALDWGRARGRDFQGLVAIVFVIDKLPTFTTPVSPALDKWLSRASAVPQKLRNEVSETFRIFLKLVKDKKYNNPFHKPSRVSPIEFIMIGVLIYQHRKTLSLMQLSSAIEKMRADVRTKEKDVRTNTRVSKALLKFINTKMNTLVLKSDGKGDKSASASVASPASATASSARKRKRLEDSDEEDEDEGLRPPPKASTSRTAAASSTRVSTQTKKAQVSTPKVSTSNDAPKASSSKAVASKSTTAKGGKTSKASTSSQASKASNSPALTTQPGPSTTRDIRAESLTSTASRPVLPPVNTQVSRERAPSHPQPASASSSSRPTPTRPTAPNSVRLPTPVHPPPSALLSQSNPDMQSASALGTQTPLTRSATAPFIKREPDGDGVPRSGRLDVLRAAKAAASGGLVSKSPVVPTQLPPQAPMGTAIASQTSGSAPPFQSNQGSQSGANPSVENQPQAIPGGSQAEGPVHIDAGSIQAILSAAGFHLPNAPSSNQAPQNPMAPAYNQLSAFGHNPTSTSSPTNANQPSGSLGGLPSHVQAYLQAQNGGFHVTNQNPMFGNTLLGQPSMGPGQPQGVPAGLPPKAEYIEPSLSRTTSRSFSGLQAVPMGAARRASLADPPPSASSTSSFDEHQGRYGHGGKPYNRERSYDRDRGGGYDRGRDYERGRGYGRDRGYDSRGYRGGRSRSTSRGRRPSNDDRYNDRSRRDFDDRDRGRGRGRGDGRHASYHDYDDKDREKGRDNDWGRGREDRDGGWSSMNRASKDDADPTKT